MGTMGFLFSEAFLLVKTCNVSMQIFPVAALLWGMGAWWGQATFIGLTSQMEFPGLKATLTSAAGTSG